MKARALLTGLGLMIGLPVAGGAVGPCAAAADAQGLNRAGLVIQFDEQRVEEFCISFADESLTGMELLERSGFEIEVEDFGANGIAVCRVDGVGCDRPDQPCFCACEDPTEECVLWGYYTLDAGAWRFSQIGAAMREVRDGDVDGWRFAAQTPSGGSAPRDADLDGVCARGTQIAAQQAREFDRSGPPVAGLVVFAIAVLVLLWMSLQMRSRRRAGGDGSAP